MVASLVMFHTQIHSDANIAARPLPEKSSISSHLVSSFLGLLNFASEVAGLSSSTQCGPWCSLPYTTGPGIVIGNQVGGGGEGGEGFMSWSTVIIHVTLPSLSCRRGAPPLRPSVRACCVGGASVNHVSISRARADLYFRRQLARRGVRVGDAQDLWFARSCPMTYVRSRTLVCKSFVRYGVCDVARVPP